jgi:gamma-glutamyltranspeptidase/glutathione hydrolase
MSTTLGTTRGIALAAPHTAAVDAAREVIGGGGNAVDAALAAAAALTVVYPHMCSIGGDAISLLRTPDGDVSCVNSTGAYGSGWLPERWGAAESLPVTGPLTVSVPGAAAGWGELWRRAGSAPIAAILAPAIRLATEGMTISEGLAAALVADAERLRLDPGMRMTFFDGEDPLPAGALVTQPALAATLLTLAEEGFEALYRGPLAVDLAASLAELGVPVTLDDLGAHQAIVEPPLVADLPGVRVATAPPNSQGFTFLRTLGAVEAGGGWRSLDPAVLAELFHAGDRLRDEVLADPLVADVDVAPLLDPAALAEARAEAERHAAGGGRPEAAATPRPGGDTIAVTVVDADGTALSLIQSVFHAFGSLILEPRTGLVLHNRAAFFTLDPASPNVLAAGKRPAHTLVPVIVTTADGSVAAHGTMGGKAQSQIHAQLLRRTMLGDAPPAAVAAPRFIVGGTEAGDTEDRIFVEGGHEPGLVAALQRTGMRLVTAAGRDSEAGHAMIARLAGTGELSAGADPRSDGGVLVTAGADA